MIRRLILLNSDDGCYDIMLDDLIILLKKFRMARYYIKSSVEAWNRREIYHDINDYFFILFPHLVQIPFPAKKYWLYFLEQNLNGTLSSWYNQKIVGTLLSDSIKNFDFNQNNIKIWQKMIPHLKMNYLPVPIYPIPNNNPVAKRYDLLFYGQMTKRRVEILKSIQGRFPHLKYCISENLKGAKLHQAMNESRILLNLHAEDGESLLEQPKLHEVLRYNMFIISEFPGIDQTELVENYKCCIEFTDIIKKDLSNMGGLFAKITRYINLTESPKCDYNYGYKILFAKHYPQISF